MASISTPTSLATFTSPHASSSSSKLPHIALNPVRGSKAKLAVAAVQGDGVWTYDVGHQAITHEQSLIRSASNSAPYYLLYSATIDHLCDCPDILLPVRTGHYQKGKGQAESHRG
jgi:hypothetical protein